MPPRTCTHIELKYSSTSETDGQGQNNRVCKINISGEVLTVSGNVTRAQMMAIITIVPNGKACVDRYPMATVLLKQNTKNSGPEKSDPVNSKFLTCNAKMKN